MANLHNIGGLRSSKRTRAERDEFIGSSLASAGRLSEAMFAWSGSNDRGRSLRMNFHQEWQHPTCPVMAWYGQQRQSSTRFRSIEHRRSVAGPFFHEFLLLKLTDGAVCQVERVGEGSRTDAIRFAGCIAHDLIKWAESDCDHLSAKRPSVLIAKVDLCREFDILDVLAVCYSIQNTKACRVYTLQRYNCYFFCLTVLAMLTRRVASWETMTSSDSWDATLSSLLEKLSKLSPEDLRKYPILRLCAFLEPENPQAGRFLIDGLRMYLTMQGGALDNYNRAVSSTLWHTAGESVLHDVLFTLLKPTVPAILEDESYCGTQFRHALHTSRDDSTLAIQFDTVLTKRCFKAINEQRELGINRAAEIYQKLRRMREVEHPTPFGTRMCSRLLGPLGGIVCSLVPASMFAISTGLDKFDSVLLSHGTMAGKMSLGRLAVSAYILGDRTSSVGDAFEEAETLAIIDRLENFVTMLLDGLAVKYTLAPSQISLCMALLLSEDYFTMLLASLVASDLNQSLDGLRELQQVRICVISASEDVQEPRNTLTTIAEFQEVYIKGRIDAHADRVALHQLAAAPLVHDDIISTMTEVWKLLPSGFGGAATPTQ
ncbi:hypothetical protein FRC10_002037 [Ceratobasidium sp. 414]|nr:hypothetical protein FRC10_002037 [Ceratobasidium sp. 414]